MTEERWLNSNPDSYFEVCEWLSGERTNHRKLRLWACTCCHRLGALLTDPRSRGAIATAERYADGLADQAAVKAAKQAAMKVPRLAEAASLRDDDPLLWAASAAALTLNAAASDFSHTAAVRAAVALDRVGRTTQDAEVEAQLSLLRDIFGNPFRPLAFDPSWRSDTAVSLARQMYEGRDFSLMPILADALQDAGCEHPDVLAHCRAPDGTHVRGCWVVDLVLGKQ